MSNVANDDQVETVPPEHETLRIVVFGIRCRFTETVVTELLQSRHDIVSLILPGPTGMMTPIHVRPPTRLLPVLGGSDIFSGMTVPVVQMGVLRSPESVALVRSLAPDIVVVACFPQRIPRVMREIPRFGALNIHPSLLPSGRGPDPLFWTLRRGDGTAGVSVHALDSRFDAGPVFSRRSFRYEDGISEAELEQRAARIGADLVTCTIGNLLSGRGSAVEQDESAASYEPWPNDSDYTIDTHRSARSAFNFIRGIADRGQPVTLETDDGPFRVVDAGGHLRSGSTAGASSPFTTIAFDDGVLLATVVPIATNGSAVDA